MTPEQREELIRLLQAGEELSPEWARRYAEGPAHADNGG